MKATKLCIAFLTGICVLAGCRNEKPAEKREEKIPEEKIVLTVFDKNSEGNMFTDPVARMIQEKTGVEIRVVNPTSEPEKRLEIMLSKKEYPDMILMGQGELVNRYIEAGAFIPLDDLISEYGSDIREMYGDVLNKSRHTDGKIYWLANWYGSDTDASAGVLMRRDILAAIAGEERAYSARPFSRSEYTDILREVKKNFPEYEGKEMIPLELDGDTGNYHGTLSGMYGLKTYGFTQQGELWYLPDTDSCRDALFYVNQLYREGLLDKEWVINKTSQWKEKMAGGYVFSSWNSYWDVEDVNDILAKKIGERAQFYCYKVVADEISPDQTTYNGRIGLGWDAIGITDNCKNPEAAIKVANFLASEEGQYLMLWGIREKPGIRQIRYIFQKKIFYGNGLSLRKKQKTEQEYGDGPGLSAMVMEKTEHRMI